MKFSEAIATPVARWLATNANWDFESTTARRRPPTRLVSQDQDLNFGTREQMMSEARTLCQTFGLASRVRRQYANYCVGSCEIDCTTGDPKWDETCEELWRQARSTIDVSGRYNLCSMARMAVMSVLTDGDIGFIKTLDNGFPQVQAIEADRIRNTNALLDLDQDTEWIGGVRVDRIGRPLAYRIYNRAFPQGYDATPSVVNAANFMHLRDPERFDGVRGVTHFSRGALNHLRDLKEILEAEKRGVKIGSKLAMIVKKVLGGVPGNNVKLFGQKADGSGNVYTEELPDGVVKYLQTGEEAESFQSNRPSPTFVGFLEFLIRDIAISFDLPLGFVWQMLGTGPAVRLDSMQAQRTFQAKIELLEWQFLNPLASWMINFWMQNGLLPFNPNWTRFAFARPAHPSIDVGRESKADLDEHERGITSGKAIAGSRGENIFKTLEQKAKEAAFAMEMATKYKVPIEMIMAFNIQPPPPPGDGPPQDA